jgi:TolB protein
MANVNPNAQLPDWWQREKQRRKLYFLVFLTLLLLLIGYYYIESSNGRIGPVSGINFDTNNYIAFVRRDKTGVSRLYAMRADGTGLRPLTSDSDKSNKFAPVWTGDGKNVIYVSDKTDGKTRQLYILGDGDPKQLTYGTGSKDAPVMRPDGQRVAFVTQGAIKTQFLNGTDVYQELPPPRAGNAPSDSGNVANMAGEPEIDGAFLQARVAADGKGIAGVQEVGAESNFSLGPDEILGDQIGRVVPAGFEHSFVLNTGREVSLDWDPLSSRIACAFTEFNVKMGGKPVLVSGIDAWTFPDAVHPDRKPIFMCLGFSIEPKNVAWSPDGKKLAFEGWRLLKEGVREDRGLLLLQVTDQPLRVRPEDADKLQYLVPASANGKPHNPRWSPDATRILYEMTRPDGGNDLWVIDADGTNPINLTHGEGDNTQGAWSPARSK